MCIRPSRGALTGVGPALLSETDSYLGSQGNGGTGALGVRPGPGITYNKFSSGCGRVWAGGSVASRRRGGPDRRAVTVGDGQVAAGRDDASDRASPSRDESCEFRGGA